MRPRPSEIIAGIRRILADTIAPELSSEHARSRLAEIRAVLAQLEWDDAAFALKARSLTLAHRLYRAHHWVNAQLPPAPVAESYDAYLQYWDSLAALATPALARMAAHLDEYPDDELVATLFTKLLDSVS